MTQEQSAPVINPITGETVRYTKTYEYADPRHPDKETKIVEYDGTIVEHTYDAAGNTTKTTRTSADGSQAVSTSFAYDANNNLTRLTSPSGGVSTFGYTGSNADLGDLSTGPRRLRDVHSRRQTADVHRFQRQHDRSTTTRTAAPAVPRRR